MEKKLSEITREEWIIYQWDETTQMGDEDRRFKIGYKRTPDEARQAMEDWDSVQQGLRQEIGDENQNI